jgi:hypothetical protein
MSGAVARGCSPAPSCRNYPVSIRPLSYQKSAGCCSLDAFRPRVNLAAAGRARRGREGEGRSDSVNKCFSPSALWINRVPQDSTCSPSPPGWWLRRRVSPGRPLSSSPSASFRFMIRRCSPRSLSWRSCGSFLGPAFHRLLFWWGKWRFRSWFEPWHRLRAGVGLPPTSEIPLFEGQNSPFPVLALFSKVLADKQPDWPQHTVITGCPARL